MNEVMKKVHKSPISRIRTRQADLRNIEALRAKGYKKVPEGLCRQHSAAPQND